MTARKIFDIIKQHHPTMGGIEIIDLMNEASDTFCRNSEIFKQAWSQYTVPGQRYYTIDGQIFKVLGVTLNEVEIPRFIGDVNIDDDELTGEGAGGGTDLSSTYDLGTPTTASNDRRWYEDLGRLAIIEKKTDAIKRDDTTSQFQSISVRALLRIKAIASPAHITTGNVGSANILSGAPGNFGRYIGDYCIAEGYRRPASLNPQQADYFDAKFQRGLKEAKKLARSRYISTGRVKPIDF